MKYLISAAIALILSAGANATTYYVDRTLGEGQVTGYIQTDDTLGTINFSNFVDYHLEITGSNFSNGSTGIIDISTSPSYMIGSSLSATAEDLLFDTTGSGFILWWTANRSHFWCLEVSGCNASGIASETLGYTTVNGANRVLQSEEFAFASVSTVPVPAAAWLFGSALLGFFGFSRRKANT